MHAVSYLALGALDKPLRLTQLFGHGQVTWKKQTQLTCSNSTEGTVDEDPLLPTRKSSGKVSGRSAASLSELTMEQNETKTVAHQLLPALVVKRPRLAGKTHVRST